VRDVGLATADDEAIWSHALEGGYIIVTKDDDFRQRSFLRGAPPKVIWTRLGNCATSDVQDALRSRYGMVQSFAADSMAALLVIARP
jgi:predicted nuclease of predicted toxin-antitoxin system